MSDKKEKGFMELVNEHMWHYKCSKVEALQAVMKAHPEAHRRYIEQANREK